MPFQSTPAQHIFSLSLSTAIYFTSVTKDMFSLSTEIYFTSVTTYIFTQPIYINILYICYNIYFHSFYLQKYILHLLQQICSFSLSTEICFASVTTYIFTQSFYINIFHICYNIYFHSVYLQKYILHLLQHIFSLIISTAIYFYLTTNNRLLIKRL